MCDEFGLLNARLRNVLLLTLTQATSSTAVTLVAAVGALAGYALASNKALATFPFSRPGISIDTSLGA